MALYTSDWNPLGKDIYYRKFELNSMLWTQEIDLSQWTVCAAPFAGPIALVRDRTVTSGQSTAPLKANQTNIYIFSSLGTLLSTLKWTGNELALISWSNREDLLCIQDDGIVFVYDIYANLQNTFTLDQEIRDTKVLECKTFHGILGTGIAVLTTTYRFFIFNNIREPKIRRLAEVPGLVRPPSSWAVIAAHIETLVVVAKDNDLYCLNANDQSCQLLSPSFNSSFSSIIEISVSFDSSHIALFTDTGVLWMGPTDNDLKTKYCEFETKANKARPQQLEWCANSAVVGLWKNILLVIGPDKDWLNYVMDGPIHMVQEVDGIRIIANETQEMLRRVTPVLVDIFGIGSVSAGALLVEANKEFQRHSHKAYEYIRMINEKNEMETAVSQCIEAAGHEYGVSTQKLLLRAASFGKCFVPQTDPKKFVEMCQTLRILNAIRHHSIAIPLTYSQLDLLTIPVLIDRLILRRHFCLALRIASYLKLPEQSGAARILGNWAFLKVKQTFLDDEKIAHDISTKFGHSPGISYSEIANKAIECGRTQLAIKLLDHEPRSSQQVPLLLKLKQHRLALQRAIESGDTNLIHTVIIRLREVLSAGEFLMTIRDYPIAYSLFQKYCREEESSKLRDLFYQEDDHQSEADCWLTNGLNTSNITQKQSHFQSAYDSYRKARNEFNASIVDENMRLIKYQIKLEEKFRRKYLNLSLHQTIRELINDKEYKLSEELKKEFKVADRRYWWLKVTVLSQTGEWLELEKFSKTKKSPIGYEPFVDLCLKHHNRFEAQKYLTRIRDENRVKYYVKCGLMEDAAKLAFEAKDLEALEYVRNRCGPTNRMLSERIVGMSGQLRPK